MRRGDTCHRLCGRIAQVLDEMRPYLLADGGNVAVREIEGPNVYLELQGACGTCPSSTMTMKMGLERGLKEKIPEIANVVQVPSEVRCPSLLPACPSPALVIQSALRGLTIPRRAPCHALTSPGPPSPRAGWRGPLQ